MLVSAVHTVCALLCFFFSSFTASEHPTLRHLSDPRACRTIEFQPLHYMRHPSSSSSPRVSVVVPVDRRENRGTSRAEGAYGSPSAALTVGNGGSGRRPSDLRPGTEGYFELRDPGWTVTIQMVKNLFWNRLERIEIDENIM